jgi:hypothetical protein
VSRAGSAPGSGDSVCLTGQTEECDKCSHLKWVIGGLGWTPYCPPALTALSSGSGSFGEKGPLSGPPWSRQRLSGHVTDCRG